MAAYRIRQGTIGAEKVNANDSDSVIEVGHQANRIHLFARDAGVGKVYLEISDEDAIQMALEIIAEVRHPHER